MIMVRNSGCWSACAAVGISAGPGCIRGTIVQQCGENQGVKTNWTIQQYVEHCGQESVPFEATSPGCLNESGFISI